MVLKSADSLTLPFCAFGAFVVGIMIKIRVIREIRGQKEKNTL